MEKKNQNFKFCLSTFFYNTIQNYKGKFLIIDTRHQDYYSKTQIKNSININVDKIKQAFAAQKLDFDSDPITIDLLNSLLTEAEKKLFEKRRRCFVLIIMKDKVLSSERVLTVKESGYYEDKYDDYFEISAQFMTQGVEKIKTTPDKESFLLALRITKTLGDDKCREVYDLLDGAKYFFDSYPFMNAMEYGDPKSHPIHYPNDMMDSRLFLGGYDLAGEWKIVDGLKVTHIINCTAECENIHEEQGIIYHQISISDEDDKPIYKYFKGAYNFIGRALEEDFDNKVLVHCARGMSRSATIVIMYMMRSMMWSYEKALDYVQKRRAIVNPNYGFIKQLQLFEQYKFDFDKFEEKCKELFINGAQENQQ